MTCAMGSWLWRAASFALCVMRAIYFPAPCCFVECSHLAPQYVSEHRSSGICWYQQKARYQGRVLPLPTRKKGYSWVCRFGCTYTRAEFARVIATPGRPWAPRPVRLRFLGFSVWISPANRMYTFFYDFGVSIWDFFFWETVLFRQNLTSGTVLERKSRPQVQS